MSKSQRIKELKQVASELRYCGYKARADYYMMQVNISDISELEHQQIQTRYSVCIMRKA